MCNYRLFCPVELNKLYIYIYLITKDKIKRKRNVLIIDEIKDVLIDDHNSSQSSRNSFTIYNIKTNHPLE